MSAEERQEAEREEALKNMHDQQKSKHALKTNRAFKGNAAAAIQGRGGRGRGGRGRGVAANGEGTGGAPPPPSPKRPSTTGASTPPAARVPVTGRRGSIGIHTRLNEIHGAINDIED